MTGKPNRADRVIAFLESRYPGWVPAIELEPIGGRQAWRTAVSEARAIVKGRGDDIENRTRAMTIINIASIETWTLSEYRLKKRGESSQTPKDERSLALDNGVKGSEHGDLREVHNETAPRDSHDLNEWTLR